MKKNCNFVFVSHFAIVLIKQSLIQTPSILDRKNGIPQTRWLQLNKYLNNSK